MLRIGVIGIGNMGSQHLRVYGDLSDKCEVVAVAERDEQRWEMNRRKTRAEYFEDYHDMLENSTLDAVSIAVPNELHSRVAVDCLLKGVDVLVEKPMALNLDDAKRMIAVSREQKRILMVGHVERFNPAVQFIRKYVADGNLGDIYYLSARRLGFYPSRFDGAGRFGVSLDLAIHDVDVMRFIMSGRPRVLHKETMRRVSRMEDYVCFSLKFGRTLGIVEASWLSPYKMRQLVVNGRGGLALVDYLAQTVEIISDYKEKPELEGYREFLDFDYETSRPSIRKSEPLRLELNHFLGCVAKRTRPISDGTNGLENLRVVA